jgi:hypothetical protein
VSESTILVRGDHPILARIDKNLPEREARQLVVDMLARNYDNIVTEPSLEQIWLFVDDFRMPPNDRWTLAQNYGSAIKYLRTGMVVKISLDYDLGRGMRNGADIAQWIVNHVGLYPVPVYRAHSSNVDWRREVEAIMHSAGGIKSIDPLRFYAAK